MEEVQLLSSYAKGIFKTLGGRLSGKRLQKLLLCSPKKTLNSWDSSGPRDHDLQTNPGNLLCKSSYLTPTVLLVTLCSVNRSKIKKDA